MMLKVYYFNDDLEINAAFALKAWVYSRKNISISCRTPPFSSWFSSFFNLFSNEEILMVEPLVEPLVLRFGFAAEHSGHRHREQGTSRDVPWQIQGALIAGIETQQRWRPTISDNACRHSIRTHGVTHNRCGVTHIIDIAADYIHDYVITCA